MPKIKHKVKQVVKRKRTSYSVEQKIQVVTYVKEKGNIKESDSDLEITDKDINDDDDIDSNDGGSGSDDG